MAKQYDGYLGGFSGRLGPAVGYVWNGRWCLRSRPGQVRNPRTEAQVAHRQLFKAEVQLAARLRWVLTTTLTTAARAEGMTAYNLFVSMNQRCFSVSAEGLAVDWARLALSVGPVAPVAVEGVQTGEGNVLTVSFERNPLHAACSQHDTVHLYVYAPQLGEGYLAAPVYRNARRVSAVLPDGLAGQEVQVYAIVQNAAGQWSPTAYGGAVVLETQNNGTQNNGNNGEETVLLDSGGERDGGRAAVGASILGDGVPDAASGEEQARGALVHGARRGDGEAYTPPDA